MEGRARSCCWRWCGCLRPPPATPPAHDPPTPLPVASPALALTQRISNSEITLKYLDDLIPLIQQEIDRLDSSSSSQAPISQHLCSTLDKYEDKKQICTSLIDSLPKDLTREVGGEGRRLLMSRLAEALGGLGAVHWLGVGFTFIAWSLDNINDTIQNRGDCIGILRKSLRLLRNTHKIWQDTHTGDDATVNEDLQDSAEKAFHCAIFCSSSLTEPWILRFLKAASVKEAIAKLDKELDGAKLQNIGVEVGDIRRRLPLERQVTFTPSPSHTVGKREVIDDAVTFLNASSHQHHNIKAVLLYGMGGIGKSTQGMQIFIEFQKIREYRACRVELPFETREGDLCDMQRQILEKLSQHVAPKFSNLTDGKQHLKKELKQINHPIFLYVDNVLEPKYLSQLLPEASFFPEGSKLLITSRVTLIEHSFRDLGMSSESYKAIEVRKLQEQESQLLLWEQLESAEGELRNMREIESLEKSVLALCDGLPLALVVVGKYIACEGGLTDVEVWRRVVEAMKKAKPFGGDRNDELYSRIQFSIQYLDEDVKRAFLDVVFFLNTLRNWEEPSWESLEWLVGQQNLKVLWQRALVRKGETGQSVEMHDVLKAQLGRRMVENDKDELRINGMDQFDELQKPRRVVALNDVTLDAVRLKEMPRLRLLKDAHVTGECQEIQLRKLRVVLGFQCSSAQVVNWSKCESLKQVHWGEDSSGWWGNWTEKDYGAPNASNLEVFKHDEDLEALALGGWSQLKDVEVIETFTCLKELRLHSCPEIESLPDCLTSLTGLRALRLSDCESLQSIPEGIANLTALTYLDLRGCQSLQSIPEGIANLTALTYLDLSDCQSLQSIPEGIANLTALTELYLSGCKSLQSIPEGIANLTALTRLDLSGCQSLQSIPEGIANLTALTELYLRGCQSLQSIPEGIANLTALTDLDLSGCKSLQSIPEGIANLTALTDLDLSDCESLQSIPEGIANLTALTWLDLSGCQSLQSIPEGIANLTALTWLDLRGCQSLQSIPEGIANLGLDLKWL